MAIVQAICSSFKKELLTGEHDFDNDTFMMALFTSEASLGEATVAYVVGGEVSGTGYTAGGKALDVVSPALANGKVVLDFADLTWGSSTITARGALIYNTTGSKAVMVLDFGTDRSSSDSDFTVQFPDPTSSNAILRIA